MPTLCLAGIPVAVSARYPYMERLCEGYWADVPAGECAFAVSATDDEIAAENTGETPFSPGYCESLALYRKISLGMLDHDACLFHAAVIEHGGRAYAFTARSGTGKSTHITQWLDALGEDVSVINGDKPLIRLQNGQFWAYGTPYNGKEGWGTNASAPLEAICFVERGEDDRLVPLEDEGEIITRMVPQLLMPKDPLLAAKQLGLLDKLLGCTNFYRLSCTPTPAAFRAAYGMVEQASGEDGSVASDR